MPDKFRVTLTKGMWQDPWPEYFDKFLKHCQDEADGYSEVLPDTEYNYEDIVGSIINHELKPHGRLIKTKTQGWYLRWDDAKYHTAFVLKWS